MYLVPLLFWLILVVFACDGPTGVMRDKFKDAFGPDFKEYTFLSYPTDNFGVATLYDSSFNDKDFLCSTWTCLGIQVPADEKQKLNLNGYADIGNGRPLTFDEDSKNEVGIKLLLPNVLKVLNIDVNATSTSDTKVEMQIGDGYKRLLLKDKFGERLSAMKPGPTKDAYNNGRLVVVVGDLVLQSVKVTISVDKQRNANLDLKLTQALQGKQAGEILGKDSALELKYGGGSNGKYEFASDKPVVVAVLTRRQPTGGVLEEAADWSDWPIQQIPFNNIVEAKKR